MKPTIAFGPHGQWSLTFGAKFELGAFSINLFAGQQALGDKPPLKTSFEYRMNETRVFRLRG
jgi:hypothetical protein